ncbi:TetR/AcrR family transcriptional regulator [Rhizobium sp. AN69]|nr:TetR/AcrR family transcriptional regulator [Rhizobium sp. AN69]
MQIFWRHGYVAASIDELSAAMGLSRSSLYKRFRDKEGLFHEVLVTYNSRVMQRMRLVQADTKREQMNALLLEFVADAPVKQRSGGCMLVKACADITELPPAGKTAALEGVEAQRVILREIVTAAVSNGELASLTDIEALVWHFLGVLQATLNLPQIGASRSDLHRMVACAMLAWPR